MTTTQQIYVPPTLGPLLYTNDSGILQVGAGGVVTVNGGGAAPFDITALLDAGASYANTEMRQVAVTTPAAASAALIVHSVTASAGALTIAAQPDVMRQAFVRIDPGTSAITAGVVTVVYVANDGTTQTDVISLVTAASTVLSTNFSKGVLSVSSATIATNFVGGATPKIQIGTNANLAVPVNQNASNFSLVYEQDDTTVTLGSGAGYGIVTPVNAPNATHSYSFGYTFVAPV